MFVTDITASVVQATVAAAPRYPARQVAETVRWPGCAVTGVTVRYHAPGEEPLSWLASPIVDEDDDITDDFDEGAPSMICQYQ